MEWNSQLDLNEEHEARIIMAEEWNLFQLPAKIDTLITEMYWEIKDEHDIILAIIHEFDSLECFARKCYWFSTANFYVRQQEEKLGAFYNSGACKPSCIPRRFRQSGQDPVI